MRWVPLALLCTACVPPFIDVTGLHCGTDDDCGNGFICFRNACARAGTVGELTLDAPALALATDEGGVLFAAGGPRRALSASRAGPWAAMTALPVARAEAGAAFVGEQLVLVGGLVGTAASSEVLVATAGADGTLSDWSPGPALPAPRRGSCAVAVGGALYVVGGRDAAGKPAAEVWVARAGLGGFSEVTRLPAGRGGHGCVVSGGALWVVGGSTEAGVSAQVLSARLRGDGGLAGWVDAGALPAAFGGERTGHGVAAFAGQLYVVGGTCTAAVCPSLTAALGLDGRVGGWRSFAALPSERAALALAVAAGALYVHGGRRSDGMVLQDVQVASLGADGLPGAWAALPGTPGRLSSQALVARGEGLYLLGGNDGTRAHLEVFRAPLRQGGTAPFINAADMTRPRTEVALAASAGFLYALGGSSNSSAPPVNSVERAQVREDGTLGPWALAGTLLSPLTGLATGAFNEFLYSAGGSTVNSGGTVDDVSFLPVHPDGTLGAATASTPLPGMRDRYVARSVVYAGRLYLTGGIRGYTPIPDVSVGQLDPLTGAVTGWRNAAPLPTPGRTGHALAAYNGVLYVLGGGADQFSGYETRVLMARIGPDGLLDGWAETTRFQVGRNQAAAFAYDDMLYLAGGCNEQGGASYCGNHLGDVQVAPILADGTVGAWSAVHSVRPRARAQVTAEKGRAFFVGGYDGNPQPFVDSTLLLGHGQLEGFRDGPALAAARDGHALVSDGERLFVTGGAGATTSVEWAAVGVDGSVAPWAAGPPLPQPRVDHASVVARGFLYVLGGASAAGAPVGTVYVAPVSAAGVGAWNVARELPGPVRGLAAVSDGERLYVVGGQDSTGVLVSAVAEDGSLGEWVAGPVLPTPRVGHGLVVAAGSIYVVAGRTGASSVADVLFSRLGSDGTPGPWARTAWLSGNREGLAAAAGGGYLYALGGRPNDPLGQRPASDLSAEVQVAPIHADGTLGEFATTSGFKVGRARSAAVVARGSLVLVGGQAATSLGDVQVARLRTPPPVGQLSLQVDLGRTVSSLRSVRVVGSSTRGRFRLELRTESEGGEVGPVFTASARSGLDVPVPAVSARYLWLRLTLDDGADAVRSFDPLSTRDVSSVNVSFSP